MAKKASLKGTGPGSSRTQTIPGLPKGRRNLIGLKIRALREGKDMIQVKLQTALAELGYHLDQSVIARIESGERSVWDYEIPLFAKALRVPVADFFS